MSELYQNIGINFVTVEARPGASIERAAADCINLANRVGGLVTLRFNGHSVNCDVWDEPKEVAQRYFDLVRRSHEH